MSEDYKSAVDESPLNIVPGRSQVSFLEMNDKFEMMIPAALTYIVVQDQSYVFLNDSLK